MKKILTHLTGIGFLISILIAGACSPSKVPPAAKDLSVVKIHVKAIKINEKNHLEMYDSNDPDHVVVDDLETLVKDGTEVFWVLTEDSGLKKIMKIRPKTDGEILNRNAKGIWLFTQYKKHIVPDNQTPDNVQGYYIKVKDEGGNRWEVDPYLRIPRTINLSPS